MENIKIINNTAESRFEADINGELARLDYHLRENNLAVMYVYVPPSYRGTGVSGQLIKAAVDFAIEQNKKLMLYCGFAAGYVKAHKEFYPYVDTKFHPTFKA